MTERTNLDRDLSAYIEVRSTTRAPAGLLESSLGGIEQTRQRAPWRLLGRRLADRSDLSMPPGSVRLVLAVITLTLALVIGVLVIAGTHRRLPPPFGPAKSGLLAVEVSGHIGVMKADGTSLTMLTEAPEVDRYPIWSPDGTRFAFVSSRDLELALVVMDADGKNRITLADHLHPAGGVLASTHFGSQLPLSWSPDSRRIVFAATIGDVPQLFVTPVDHPGATAIGQADLYGSSLSWSPDGRLIAFIRFGEPNALWVMSPDGEDSRKLSDTPAVIGVLTNAAWAPDGRRLAFLAEGAGHNNDVYLIDADGTNQHDITNTPEDEWWASWSPDGTRLAVGGAGGMFVIDADGSNRTDLPTGGHSISTPAWSPDGSRILGYFDASLQHFSSDGLVVLDPTGHDSPIFIPEPAFGSVTWQRLAP
jgi:TolB protein